MARFTARKTPPSESVPSPVPDASAADPHAAPTHAAPPAGPGGLHSPGSADHLATPVAAPPADDDPAPVLVAPADDDGEASPLVFREPTHPPGETPPLVFREPKRRRRRGGADTRTPTAPPSLGDLHALLRHYAQTYLDLQSARIGMVNRAHAIPRPREQGGLGMDPGWAVPVRTTAEELEDAERAMSRELVRLMADHPLGPFIEQTRGAGLPSNALLLGLVGYPGRFANPGKLWSYAGYDVKSDNRAGRRKRGVKPTPRAEGGEGAWSPMARTVGFRIADAFVKTQGSPYRELYLRKKQQYLEKERTGPSQCPFGQVHLDANGKAAQCGLAHLDQAAKRYAIKAWLKALWKEAKRVTPWEGPPAATARHPEDRTDAQDDRSGG